MSTNTNTTKTTKVET